MYDFAGKVYIVTGGANGQGAAEARLLAQYGARVVVTDVDVPHGEALAAALPQAQFVRHDVSDEAQWQHVVQIARQLGQIGGLVNNAGIYRPASLKDTSAEDFIRHFQVNQLGCFLGMKAVIPELEAQGGGAIVNIGSSAGMVGSVNSFAYCATKWAMRGMTRATALAFGPSNIRVNTVIPGPVDTDMIQVRTQEQNAARMQRVPLKRFGTSQEVAELVIYLLSEKASFITGADMLIDGGIVL